MAGPDGKWRGGHSSDGNSALFAIFPSSSKIYTGAERQRCNMMVDPMLKPASEGAIRRWVGIAHGTLHPRRDGDDESSTEQWRARKDRIRQSSKSQPGARDQVARRALRSRFRGDIYSYMNSAGDFDGFRMGVQ
jgi:hypothetical protein